jgi:SAM-dependent methyltransferase
VKLLKEAWDKAFQEKGRIWTNPQEDIPWLAKRWKKEGVKRILDLGCGTGRHAVYLAKNGFEVYGMDIAKTGIKIAKEWLEKERLRAKLRVGDVYKKLPYKNCFFDAIVCVRTLNHGRIEWIRKAIEEMYRILRAGGYIFIVVHKHKGKKHIQKDKLYGIKWIAPRTYVILSGPEKGLIHYRFNKKILISEFKKVGFKVLDFWIDSEGYYCMLCRKSD